MPLYLPNALATEALAQQLARCRPASAVVYLLGEIGAGKSTFARACLRQMGVRGAIKSPTYTLIERYPITDRGAGEAAHLDLYRLASSSELHFLGLDELHAQCEFWLIEWPEQGAGALPKPDLRIEIALHEDGRMAMLSAESQQGEQWLQRWQSVEASTKTE